MEGVSIRILIANIENIATAQHITGTNKVFSNKVFSYPPLMMSDGPGQALHDSTEKTWHDSLRLCFLLAHLLSSGEWPGVLLHQNFLRRRSHLEKYTYGRSEQMPSPTVILTAKVSQLNRTYSRARYRDAVMYIECFTLLSLAPPAN